jgi:hypothetical protein
MCPPAPSATFAKGRRGGAVSTYEPRVAPRERHRPHTELAGPGKKLKRAHIKWSHKSGVAGAVRLSTPAAISLAKISCISPGLLAATVAQTCWLRRPKRRGRHASRTRCYCYGLGPGARSPQAYGRKRLRPGRWLRGGGAEAAANHCGHPAAIIFSAKPSKNCPPSPARRARPPRAARA